jgi:hypothetical protein
VHTADTHGPAGDPIAVVDQLEIAAPERADHHRHVARERSRCIAPRSRDQRPRRAHYVPKGFETASIAPLSHATEARSEAKASDARAVEVPYKPSVPSAAMYG